MRKKWLCSLLTAALLLSLFPTAALADEDGPDASAEGVVETVAEEQAVVDPELLEMLPSNDELFSAYVDLAFAGEDADVPSIFGVGDPAYNRLGHLLFQHFRCHMVTEQVQAFSHTGCLPQTKRTEDMP